VPLAQAPIRSRRPAAHADDTARPEVDQSWPRQQHRVSRRRVTPLASGAAHIPSHCRRDAPQLPTCKIVGDHVALMIVWTLYGHKTHPDNSRRPRRPAFAVAKSAGNQHYPQTTTTTVRKSLGSGSWPRTPHRACHYPRGVPADCFTDRVSSESRSDLPVATSEPPALISPRDCSTPSHRHQGRLRRR
jgi:hypothetical protein